MKYLLAFAFCAVLTGCHSPSGSNREVAGTQQNVQRYSYQYVTEANDGGTVFLEAVPTQIDP